MQTLPGGSINRRLIAALGRPPRALSILAALWLAVIVVAMSDIGTWAVIEKDAATRATCRDQK